MIYTDNDNRLYDVFDKVLQFLINPYKSFVDVGCGTGNHTRNLVAQKKLYVDIQEIKDPPQPFVKMDIEDIFFTNFDVLIALDFLEHLTKEDGYKFLIRAIQTNKLIILFSPEGEYIVPDAVGPDQHQAAWTAEEMQLLGFNVWLCPNYHPTLNIGAFLCWLHVDKTRDYSPSLLKGLFK